MDIIQSINDPNLLGKVYPEDKTSFFAPFTMLKCIYGLPMTPEEEELARKCTGGRDLPTKQVKEAYLITGRRGNKSWSAAILAVHEAFHTDFTPYLSPGEMATILIIAVDKQQAMIIFRYIRSIIEAIPMYKSSVIQERAMDLQLSNQVQIIIRTSSYAAVRGYTFAMVILEECSFWHVSGVNPDHEVLAALRPGLATIPSSMLVAVSSPYGRAGILYEAYRDYYGVSSPDIMVWSAPSRMMNPTISQEFVDREYEKDPISAASEYGAKFRADIETCFPLEWLEAAVVPDRFELPPVPSVVYKAFMDPSGGASSAFTLSIGHREGNRLLQDVLRAFFPPFSPKTVVAEFSQVLKEYGINEVVCDRWGGGFVVEAFRTEGIKVIHSKKPKSELFLDLEPILARSSCDILDNPTQFAQLRGLERRRGRAGRDIIQAPPRQHDDLANSLAGLFSNLEHTYTDITVFDLLEEVSKREIIESSYSKTR